jgi:hypothetical protein
VFFGSSSSNIEHVGIVVSGTGSSAEIISAISEHYGIATQTVAWFQHSFSWTGAVAPPGLGNTTGGGPGPGGGPAPGPPTGPAAASDSTPGTVLNQSTGLLSVFTEGANSTSTTTS